MDMVIKTITILLAAAKSSPRVALFLVAIGFLAFALYGALFIANQGIWDLLVYVFLAICAFVVLIIIVLLNNDARFGMSAKNNK